MPKTKSQKQTMLTKLTDKINQSKSLVIAAFDKLPVKDDYNLRQAFKKEKVNYHVVKKTLLEKTLTAEKLSGWESINWQGNIGLADAADEVAGAKVMAEFAKDKEHFRILGGFLNKTWLDHEKIMALAKLPNYDQLVAQTVGTLKAPLSGLVNVLNGNIKNLVNVFNAIKDNK